MRGHFLTKIFPERGLVRPTRDLERLHELLIARGAARPLGDDDDAFAPEPVTDRDAAVAEVRSLLGCPTDLD